MLASLVLIASMGVTINLHLCAGQVKSVAFFTKAQPCQDLQKSCDDARHHLKSNGCCEEESIALKGNETNAEVKTPTSLSPSFNLLVVILPVLYYFTGIDYSIATPRYAHYKPPLIKRDITILVQSFQI
jgi:hypothetical protein